MELRSPRSRLSTVDVPAPFTPPSPDLSVSQSWTSGEIPIYLDLSSITTAQVPLADAAAPALGSVGTFGQPVRCSAGAASRLSSSSTHSDPCDPYSSSSNCSTPTTISFSFTTNTEDEPPKPDQGESVLKLSTYFASRDSYCGVDSFMDNQHMRLTESHTTRLEVPCPPDWPRTLISLDWPLSQSRDDHRRFNCYERFAQDVPLSPVLLSPTAPATMAAPVAQCHQHRHLRTVSAPSLPQYSVINTMMSLHPSTSYAPAHHRTHSNPHLPITVVSQHPHPLLRTPRWLCEKAIELWIDQEGFRAIRPRLELASFAHGAGLNVAGETLDVAEFSMRRRQSWHFHYAPLDSAPVLRRLTVDGDMNDYISRQAALILRRNGIWAVESTEAKGRVAWKFEYQIDDRRDPESGKIMDGEKRFTPLRFVCNPTLLGPGHGKKVKLLQFVRKSVRPKLSSVLLCPEEDNSVRNRVRRPFMAEGTGRVDVTVED